MKHFFKLDIQPNRVFGLDILRALAIFFVVFAHASSFLPANLKGIANHIQYDGVSIFFVLSGYLIGGILIKLLQREGTNFKSLVNFWIRRWFRTLPNYFLVLTVLSLLYLNFTDYYSFREVKSYFIFSQNLWYPHPTFFPEAWSLSVEEWFYILIPMLFFGMVRFLKLSVHQTVIVVAILIIIAVICFRWYRFTGIEVFDDTILNKQFRTQVITRLDSLMYGIIGIYTATFHQKFWKKYQIPLFILGILLFLFTKYGYGFLGFKAFYHSVFSFSIFAFATLCVLPLLSNIKKGKGILFYIFTYLSLISYSMYLLNISIHTFIDKVGQYVVEQSPGNFLLILQYMSFWLITVIASLLLYKYFELPIMRLRDKIRLR